MALLVEERAVSACLAVCPAVLYGSWSWSQRDFIPGHGIICWLEIASILRKPGKIPSVRVLCVDTDVELDVHLYVDVDVGIHRG